MKISVKNEQTLVNGYISHLADLAESFFPDDLAAIMPHLEGGVIPVIEDGVSDEEVIAAKMLLSSVVGTTTVGTHLPELMQDDAEAYSVIFDEVGRLHKEIAATAIADEAPRVKMSL